MQITSNFILEVHAERFNHTLNELEGKDFVDVYIKVLGFFKPRLKAMEQKQTNSKIEVVYRSPDCEASEDEERLVINFRDSN